jgi:phenylalanyl-tRNA synthetase beta chain
MDVKRWLGIELSVEQIAAILSGLNFQVEVDGQFIRAATPDHRLDIGTGIVGAADLMEEVARIYGYDRIPETRLSAELPPQRSFIDLEREERLRDLLVGLGLQEVITYRLTSQEREARRFAPEVPADDKPYVTLANPIVSDRDVLRHSLLSSMLEVVERNARLRERMALFEIGPVYLASEEGILPDEVPMLVIALTGPRDLPAWQGGEPGILDFYDLKGILDALFSALHLEGIRYEPSEHPSFHPGKCARILLGEQHLGALGVLHPLVREHYELPETPLLAAECNLQTLLNAIQDRFSAAPVLSFPPALEDLAVIVAENIPGVQVEDIIRKAGGSTLSEVQLFDVYRGEQIGAGLKSLAYSLTYQASDHTLTDTEVLALRQRIIRRLEQELGARLRS